MLLTFFLWLINSDLDDIYEGNVKIVAFDDDENEDVEEDEIPRFTIIC